MKLNSIGSIFNLGDTSIRVKQVVDVNLLILNQLREFWKAHSSWSSKEVQEQFYVDFINEVARLEDEEGVDLFYDFIRLKNYKKPDVERVGMRGRTLTNMVTKLGFIDRERQLSEVGKNHLGNNNKKPDSFENQLMLDMTNLVYFRQCLKLRVYAHDSDNYIYPFRIALLLLTQIGDINADDILCLLESISPDFSDEEIKNLVVRYKKSVNNNENFRDFYFEHFNPAEINQALFNKAKSIFAENNFSDDNLAMLFTNGKSSGQSFQVYRSFVLALIDLVENRNYEALLEVKSLAENNRVKKAFTYNKTGFVFTQKETVDEFLENNKDNPLLSSNHFAIYEQFCMSKRNDLIREYSDMCRRVFSITGAISFSNNLAKLNDSWAFEALFSAIGDNFSLSGNDSYEAYENDLTSSWFSDVSSIEILSLSKVQLQAIEDDVKSRFEVDTTENLSQILLKKKEHEYINFILTEFPKEKVIKVLELINDREDVKVFKLVTNQATIPTIYEYILTIAWYYISGGEDYLLHKSFQVSLDASKLPLSHRGGHAGDIEIITSSYALLIEATLMDRAAQKRGELEPVIRHSINFKLNNATVPKTYTLFVSNELDANVINLFRACEYIEFKGTLSTGDIEGLTIFSLRTKDIIQILEQNITASHVQDSVFQHRARGPELVKHDWRTETLDAIFSR